MQKGSRHTNETKQRVSQSMRDAWARVQSAPVVGEESSPLTLHDVTRWIEGLGDGEFLEFTKKYIIPRVTILKKRDV